MEEDMGSSSRSEESSSHNSGTQSFQKNVADVERLPEEESIEQGKGATLEKNSTGGGAPTNTKMSASVQKSPRSRARELIEISGLIDMSGKMDMSGQLLNGIDKSAHSINRLGKSDHRRKSIQNGTGGPKLSWKSDPGASFSDWRVEVYSAQSADCEVYNIHRNIVGFGPRKSDYFKNKFMEQSKNIDCENDANVSSLELSESQAQVFPMVLDFMYYTKEVKQAMTAEIACAVCKLAEELEVPPLQNAIVEFYRKNINLKNMGEFIACAQQVKADRLMLVAKATIGSLVTEKPELAGLVPPKFLADILEIDRQQLLELREKDPEKYSIRRELSQSRHWSKAAYICASENESMLTKRLFEQLTSEELLPAIDPSVAVKLLELDSKVNKGSSEWTSLQKRCVESMTDDWDTFQQGFDNLDGASDALKNVPSHILADILVKYMSKKKG